MDKSNLKENLKIAAILCTLFLAIATPITILALLYAEIQLPTTGEVTTTIGLELYDYETTTPQISLDWGIIGEGPHTQLSTLKNVGNVDLQLTMTTDEAYGWLEQTWDQEGTVLTAGGEVTVTWTLTLTNAEGGNFNYMTTITGTETP